MIRSLFLLGCLILGAVIPSVSRADSRAHWSLYTWMDRGKWSYSLVHDDNKHPDGQELRLNSTHSLEAIKTRISLLDQGSTVQLNPLPVLNLEMHVPPVNTIQEFQRVCDSARINLVR